MSDTERESQYLIKLRRLWKGTLYIGIVAVYIAIVIGSLLLIAWQAGLLVLSLVALSQLFRYVASEVDRIGWLLQTQNLDDDRTPDDEVQSNRTNKLRRNLLGLLTLLVQLPNLALIIYVYEHVGLLWSVSSLLLLGLIESMFQEIRRVNRKVAYREASYGFQDRSMLSTSHHDVTRQGRAATLEDRLEQLEALVDEGKISRASYEKARDKYWIRHVMESSE
ncbi:MAG: hypothetical protein OXG05_12030 [Gammaproteobacteria bacterium]|nr:hypothetical protein [Gammaproteobacteria bacterium]